MSLRLRLAYAFFLLAAAVGLLTLLGGYLAFRGLVERDIAQDLHDLAGRVARALALTPEGPRLAEADPFTGTHYIFGFRLLQEERPVLEGGWTPVPGETWRTLTTPWQGYQLEVGLRVEEYERAVRAFVQAGLGLLFPLLLLAGAAGYATAGRFSRPLAGLAQAVESLSRLHFPEPLPPPPGGERELLRLTYGVNRLVKAVRSALERERLFTRYASHELRSPLAVWRSQLYAAKAGLVPWAQALPPLEEALGRMEAILQGLLALARLEEADLEPLELRGFLEGYLRSHPKQVSLYASGTAWILAHPTMLERLLENLLDNAFRHGAPPVEVRLSALGREALLEVRDHGPGVIEEERGKLTQPFFRRKEHSGGLGLGLALAAQVVERLGGTLEFEEARPGLLVRVRLPRWEPLTTGND